MNPLASRPSSESSKKRSTWEMARDEAGEAVGIAGVAAPGTMLLFYVSDCRIILFRLRPIVIMRVWRKIDASHIRAGSPRSRSCEAEAGHLYRAGLHAAGRDCAVF